MASGSARTLPLFLVPVRSRHAGRGHRGEAAAKAHSLRLFDPTSTA